ncbi:bifunctional lysylphosphatidylglycerol flippase/synthetase MprF [Streptomyces sp. NPDC057131]|uniref:bifunctional lysylphosphatidylglycerol flippase/synthetase MprF n=1 Tax=Streptomyces sp. NPDC057131 TaxID=3346027 RepID=UPI0036D431A2
MDNEKIKSEKMERAYRILKECSFDSLHYLSFKEENMFFFGEKVCGMISYELAGKKAMSIGDPVCKPKDMELLTVEYINFCEKMGWKPVFNSVSVPMVEILKKNKFSVLKYGEEAILELSEYTLAGGTRATLRRNVSKVEKRGIRLREYHPQNERDYALEKEVIELSEKWYADKKYKMNYSIGSLDFDEPYDRRFFVTIDVNGILQTFLSFLPYEGGKSFCVDIMHRNMDAMTGVMEHAIISAAMKLKEEGVSKVSLGIAPLAGIDATKPDVCRAEKLMNAIFHNMNSGYNFKNLYRFKKKFDPTIWEPRYLVYNNSISLVDLAVSITNTKRGSADLVLYAKYKFFFIAVSLGLYKVEKNRGS